MSGLTITEAAARLRIAPEAVRKRIRRGRLSARKEAGRWYVSLSEQDPAAARPRPAATVAEAAPSSAWPFDRARRRWEFIRARSPFFGLGLRVDAVLDMVAGLRREIDAAEIPTASDLLDRALRDLYEVRQKLEEAERTIERAYRFSRRHRGGDSST